MDDKLPEIKERRKSITHGVWQMTNDIPDDVRVCVVDEISPGEKGCIGCVVLMGSPEEGATLHETIQQQRSNALFIAAAPADYDWMIAEIEALRKQLYAILDVFKPKYDSGEDLQ